MILYFLYLKFIFNLPIDDIPTGNIEPLLKTQGTYVNYESAVNPEYYDKTLRYTKPSDYGILIVHRKLGLSTPNEKIVYQTWMVKELKNFINFLLDYSCIKRDSCSRRTNFRPFYEKLKTASSLEQEKFAKEISSQEFINICDSIMEIYDKYYDIGYCYYEGFKPTRKNIEKLYENIIYVNITKIGETIDLILEIEKFLSDYLKKCNPSKI